MRSKNQDSLKYSGVLNKKSIRFSFFTLPQKFKRWSKKEVSSNKFFSFDAHKQLKYLKSKQKKKRFNFLKRRSTKKMRPYKFTSRYLSLFEHKYGGFEVSSASRKKTLAASLRIYIVRFKRFLRYMYGSIKSYKFKRIHKKYSSFRKMPFYACMESLLIAVIIRLGFVQTLSASRLLILNGFVYVNSRRIRELNYQTQVGDLISLDPSFNYFGTYKLVKQCVIRCKYFIFRTFFKSLSPKVSRYIFVRAGFLLVNFRRFSYLTKFFYVSGFRSYFFNGFYHLMYNFNIYPDFKNPQTIFPIHYTHRRLFRNLGMRRVFRKFRKFSKRVSFRFLGYPVNKTVFTGLKMQMLRQFLPSLYYLDQLTLDNYTNSSQAIYLFTPQFSFLHNYYFGRLSFQGYRPPGVFLSQSVFEVLGENFRFNVIK